MIETHISILVELAGKDGEIHSRELQQIVRIGTAHGLSEEEVENLIKNSKPINWADLRNEERFDMLHNVVQLMKADGQIYDEEILFCLDTAKRLGYPLEAVFELYSVVHSNLKLPDQVARLRKKYS